MCRDTGRGEGEAKRQGRYKKKEEQKQKGCTGYAAIGISGTPLIVFQRVVVYTVHACCCLGILFPTHWESEYRRPGTGVPTAGNRSTDGREQEYRQQGAGVPAAPFPSSDTKSRPLSDPYKALYAFILHNIAGFRFHPHGSSLPPREEDRIRWAKTGILPREARESA